jgi:signal transduction histidine kinase
VGHLGVRLLADRVDALGGVLVGLATPGQGTTVRAEIPSTPVGSSGHVTD